MRCHPTTPPQPGQAMRVEHEYDAGRGAGLPGRLGRAARRGDRALRPRPPASPRSAQLVDQVMAQEPYRSRPARLLESSTTAAATGARRPQTGSGERYPNLILVHLPTHASWLNQIEIYFSIIQRKVLTPNDFPDLAAVEQRLLRLRGALQRHRRALQLALHARRPGPPPGAVAVRVKRAGPRPATPGPSPSASGLT